MKLQKLHSKTITAVILIMMLATNFYAQNTAPTAVDDFYRWGYNYSQTITAMNGVLANDTDNTTLGVQTTPVIDVTDGNLTLNTNGSFTYTPNSGFVGTDSFTYRVCDNGVPSTMVSQFDFDTATLTDATVGPNATAINPNAVPIECGLHIPRGSTGGNVGLDMVIPNTGGIFNFSSFALNFEYRDQESQASLVDAGNFRLYHIGPNNLGMQLTVINGTTGLPQTYTTNFGAFLPGNASYAVVYSEVTGVITFTANGTVTSFNVAPPFSPLDTSLASAITIGRQLDNGGRDFASFCSISFEDRSILCDTAEVTIEVRATVITNKRITYRVNPN